MEGEHWLMRSGVKSALTATAGTGKSERKTVVEAEAVAEGHTSLLTD